MVADQWRKTQSEQRSQIGRTYPVDSVSERDTAPAFAVASSDDDPPPPAKTKASSSSESSRSQSHSQSQSPQSSSSTRSSPRDQHSSAQAQRRPSQVIAAGRGGVHGRSPQQHQPQGRQGAQYAHDGGSGTSVGSGFARGEAGGRTLQPQQSLPSLKASGLLDYSKPVTDAFSQASISRADDCVPHGRGQGRTHGHSQSLGRVNVQPPPSSSAPMGYNWMSDGQQGGM